MHRISAALLCSVLAWHSQVLWAQTATPAVAPPAVPAEAAPAAPAAPAEAVPAPAAPADPAAKAAVPAGTPLIVATLQNLTTAQNKLGDQFGIVLLEDLLQDGTIVVPKGAQGIGEVTFVSDRGGFGKAGILQIKVVSLTVGDRTLPLDGRFRQEGTNKAGVTAATYFAVGIFAGFIKGKSSGIERGRLLKARTAEPFEFVIGLPPPAVPDLPPPPPEEAVAPADGQTSSEAKPPASGS